MDKLHAAIHKASRSVRLDPHAKAGFRRTLEALTGSPAAVPVPSRLPRALAWALAAVVIASTGATATYASSLALPGEALYQVKVGVLEPAEAAFALTADAKADVAVAHLERRFQEAAALSAAGTLDAHDEELAARAEADVAAVDREDQPVAKARFEALAAVYGPSLKLRDVTRSRFAAMVRLQDAKDPVSDDVAQATAREQLRTALAKAAAAQRASADAAVSSRLQKADRLSRAASFELDRGSYQAALKLSGAAATAATEAELFAAFGATSTTSTDATVTSTATTSLKTKPAKPRVPRQETPSGAGGVLHNLFN